MENPKVKKIMEQMQGIQYGFKVKGENIIEVDPEKWDREFNDFYYLQTPAELQKSQCGVCWDQVELERQLFQENNLACQTYFIFMQEQDMLPSHTFLTFQADGQSYWFEHSWQKYAGIWAYPNEDALLRDVSQKFRLDHDEVSKDAKLYLYKYDVPPKHITCNEFYGYIETQELIEI